MGSLVITYQGSVHALSITYNHGGILLILDGDHWWGQRYQLSIKDEYLIIVKGHVYKIQGRFHLLRHPIFTCVAQIIINHSMRELSVRSNNNVHEIWQWITVKHIKKLISVNQSIMPIKDNHEMYVLILEEHSSKIWKRFFHLETIDLEGNRWRILHKFHTMTSFYTSTSRWRHSHPNVIARYELKGYDSNDITCMTSRMTYHAVCTCNVNNVIVVSYHVRWASSFITILQSHGLQKINKQTTISSHDIKYNSSPCSIYSCNTC